MTNPFDKPPDNPPEMDDEMAWALRCPKPSAESPEESAAAVLPGMALDDTVANTLLLVSLSGELAADAKRLFDFTRTKLATLS